VLSGLPCEAPKNPPTASWKRDARLSRVWEQKIIKNETQTTTNQFKAQIAEGSSALPATS
jgi:hypothetical protein